VPAFVDTNVAVYALGRDSNKKARAKRILDDAPIASTQVINEAISVLMGKQRFAREEAYEVADAVMKLVAVAPVTANTVRDAMTVGLRYGLSHESQVIVHTDGRLRPIKLGNLTLQFKLTAPSKLYRAVRPAMRIVQLGPIWMLPKPPLRLCRRRDQPGRRASA